jgi:GAF domain-containing protein
MDKKEKYEAFLPQLAALVEGEHDATAVMANASAALASEFGWFWTGFYVVSADELLLGPFQGPVACYHIGYGRGVCGTAWQQDSTVVVKDVEEFPGHIACSSLSRSEIVVPLHADGRVCAVLDIDSTEIGTFDDTDRRYLEQAAAIIAAAIEWKATKG